MVIDQRFLLLSHKRLVDNSKTNAKNLVRRKKNEMATCLQRTLFSLDNGGAELAHSADSLKPLSIFHIDTSLLPCEADISHDGSVGCGATLRMREVNGCEIVAEKLSVSISDQRKT